MILLSKYDLFLLSYHLFDLTVLGFLPLSELTSCFLLFFFPPPYSYCFKNYSWDFPGGPVVKNPPCNAGDMGSIPGQGTKIPHAAGQLSLCATTTELTHLNQSPHAANYRAHAPQPQKRKTHTPQLERSLRAATKDPAGLNEDPTCCN